MDYQPLRVNPITYATHGVDFSCQQPDRLRRVHGVSLDASASQALRVAKDFRESVTINQGDVTAVFKKVFMKATVNVQDFFKFKRHLLEGLRAMSLDVDTKLAANGVFFTDGKDGPRLYVKHKTYITL